MQTRLDLYQSVTPLAGLGIFERKYTTGEIYWNAVIRSIYGVDEHYQPNVDDFLNFYKRPEEVKKLIAVAVASGKPETATLDIVSKNQVTKWVKINLQADVVNGNCTRLYGTIQDVSEVVKMIGTLEEREKLLAMAFDYAPIGMALVSLTGGWIKVNASLCSMLGYEEKQFLKHTFQDFTHPEDLDKDLELLHQLVDGKIAKYSMEKRYYHADGNVIWAALNVSLVRNDIGEPLYFVSQIKNITERIKNTETIRNQNSRLLSFAHIVSHNLRSHTGNMKMVTDMILEEEDAAEKNNMIRMLNDISQNLLETLEDLSDIVDINEGANVEATSLNLNGAVQRVLSILSVNIRQLNAAVSVAIPEDIYVGFHPAYLESVVMNLVSNSLKYKHPDRTSAIEIWAVTDSFNTALYIRDNGLGIDLSVHRNHLFGMYKTFHNHPEARGIGLFLVKNQVEAMGGHISVQSEEGKGTTFIIHFTNL